ncbi:MAG: hypothetical protein FJ006_12430 [Chloroflexi bacterium]|nr:hypothetical protein [Chloroflexota bacterium]
MTVTIVNLILTTVIFILGIGAYIKRKSDVAAHKLRGEVSAPGKAIAIPEVSLYIGIAFGLFAISHALTLAGLAKTLEAFIITIRVIGYLLVLVAPCRILMKR